MIITLGNDSQLALQVFRLFVRHVAEIVLHCAMMLSTCFATATLIGIRQVVQIIAGVLPWAVFKNIVAVLPLQKVEPNSTFCDNYSNEKKARNVLCRVCYNKAIFWQLVLQQNARQFASNVA